MANIQSISIDGTSVTEGLLKHTRLVKIIKSDKILADHLFLIINKEHYKGHLPKEHSVIEFTTVSRGPSRCRKEIFYIYKDDNASNRVHLTEAEKALAKDPNNVVFHGLSVKTGFRKFYEDAIDRMTTPPDNVFKNQTLKEVLECIKEALGLDELVVKHQDLNTKIPYLKVTKMQLEQSSSYAKTILEELAELFYAVAHICNNKLYFLQKCYCGKKKSLSYELSLSNSSVIDISYIKGEYDNQPQYKGVRFSYFKQNERNIILAAKPLGVQPFFKLDAVYEEHLAKIYAVSKLKEIAETPILKLTVKDIQNRMPGYYLNLVKSMAQQNLEKRFADIIGGHSVKSCIVTYNPYGHTHQDPNKAGPSAKKPKLEPSWSTTLHLIKMLPGLNKI